MRLQKTLQRFHNQFKTKRRRQAKKRSRRLQLEHLEDRTLLSTILWTNRGGGSNDTDGFFRVFGNNADVARSDVDAALLAWQNMIGSFNYADSSLNDTLRVSISMSTSAGIGASTSYGGSWQNNGKPTQAAISINTGFDANGTGWFVEPTPNDNSEFRGLILDPYVMRATPGGPADGLFDLYSVVSIEMAHAVGLNDSSDDLFVGGPIPNHYLTNTGQADTVDVPGTLWTYNGPDVQALFTSDNGDSQNRSEPLHVARPSLGNLVTSGGSTYYGVRDTDQASFDSGLRYLPSYLDGLVLQDSYGYTVNIPSQNAYINFDPASGNILVRGGSHGENIYSSQANPSDDFITLNAFSVYGITVVTVSVSIGNPTPGTGPNITYFNAFLASTVTSITVVGGDGNDVVNVEGTVPGVPVTINEGSGNDTVGISRSAEFLDNIQGNVFVNGGSGADTLNIYDQNNSRSDTWTITGSNVIRSSAATIFYNGQNNVVINGGSGNLTYNVLSTEAFFSTSIDTGPGIDTVNVQSTGVFSTLTINNLFSTSNHDTVNIGSLAPSLGGTLANIAGTVNVANSSGGGTTLTVDDSGDTTGQTFTVTSGSITGTAFSGAINYNGNNGGHEVTTINLLGGDGGNTFNVQSTAPGTPISINTDDTTTANTNNHVNIGSTAPTLGGTLANVAGPVNVSSTSGSTTLTVDDSGDTTGQTFTVTNNSITGTAFTGAINYSQVSTLTFDGGSGVDTYNVQSTAFGTTTNLVLQSLSTVRVGSLAPSLGGTLGNIAGPLNISNSSVMVVDDSGDSAAQTTTITNNSIIGLAPAAISYTNVGSLHINGGTGGDTFNVLSTASGTTTDIVGHGTSTVKVGNAGSVQAILGALNIENPPSFNTVVVDDSADATARTVTLSSGGNSFNDSEGSGDTYGFITGLAPATISYEYFDTTSLTINGGGGTGVHTWNVQATGVTTTINGGAGNDVFNVGSGGGSSTLDAIQGALTVNGGLGTNTLNVNDQGTPGGSYTLSSTVLSRVSPASVSITYGTIKTLNLNAGGNNTLTVLLPVPTTTTNFNAGGGTNTLIGANTSNTWIITNTNKGTLGKIAFTNVQNLIGGTGSDTFKFSGALANITGNVSGGAGTDKLDYSLDGGLAIAVNLQTGIASRIGGTFSGIDSLVGSTSTADTLTAADTFNNWSITGANAGKVNTFSFTGIENLIGGTGVDVFKISPAGTELSIDAGGAPLNQGNWLDYTPFTTLQPLVVVNLATNAATNVNGGAVGAIANIQDVRGGNGGNILTGNSQGNILVGGTGADTITGGSGRSLLIGDLGADNVTGGSGASASGGDILIGGTTIWDSDTNPHLLSLMSILAEWQSANSYATRVSHLRLGGGLNGTNKLTWETTVKDDLAANVLTAATAGPGTPAVDWFFTGALDTAINTETGEAHNNGTF